MKMLTFIASGCVWSEHWLGCSELRPVNAILVLPTFSISGPLYLVRSAAAIQVNPIILPPSPCRHTSNM